MRQGETLSMKRLLCVIAFYATGILSPFLFNVVTYAQEKGASTEYIYILNTGDIHEHPEYLPRIAAYIKYMKQHYSTIAIDAGDALTDYAPGDPKNGSLWNRGTKGNLMYRAMSKIPYDAMTIGNHDLCYGERHLADLIKRWNLPVMGANVMHSSCDMHFMAPPVFGFRDASVGLVGTISTHRWHLEHYDPSSTFRVADIQSRKVYDAINNMKGRADIVLLLTHELDSGDKDSADKIRGISVVVGGHSHKDFFDYHGSASASIVKAGWEGRYVRSLRLTCANGRIVGASSQHKDMRDYSYKDEEVERLLKAPAVKQNDVDGDGVSELVVYHGTSGRWESLEIDGTGPRGWTFPPHEEDAVPVCGDFDGDGKSDPALYAPSTGRWLTLCSTMDYAEHAVVFGGEGGAAALGDYDGDLITDRAIYDAGTGRYRVQLSAYGGSEVVRNLGGPGYAPSPGYYDDDALVDPAVYDEVTGRWIALLSSEDYRQVSLTFGGHGSVGVSACVGPDNRGEPAVYNESEGRLTVALSDDGYRQLFVPLGGPGYVPVAGDYDGDGFGTVAVYREASGTWVIADSRQNYSQHTVTFGGPGWEAVR